MPGTHDPHARESLPVRETRRVTPLFAALLQRLFPCCDLNKGYRFLSDMLEGGKHNYFSLLHLDACEYHPRKPGAISACLQNISFCFKVSPTWFTLSELGLFGGLDRIVFATPCTGFGSSLAGSRTNCVLLEHRLSLVLVFREESPEFVSTGHLGCLFSPACR